MRRKKNRIVPAVSDAKYKIKYSKRPPEFRALTVWALPDELNFAVSQLEDSKRTYCIEHHSPDDNRIRVWTKSFIGHYWFEGE